MEEKTDKIKKSRFLAFLDRFLDRIFAVLGAFVFSQIPAFMQQYIQNLSGRVAELQHQVQILEKYASRHGKSTSDYIKSFLASSNSDLSEQGSFLQEMVERLAGEQHSLEALHHSSWWAKPFVFFWNFDWSVSVNTAKYFRPALALTLEGVLWAFIGLLFGYFFYNFLKSLVTRGSS